MPDTRLPATRKLAQDLGISRITVQNAYADLESEGLIGSREGSGSYVLPPIHLPTRSTGNTPVSWPLWQQDLLGLAAKPQKRSQPQSLTFFP